MKTKMRLMKAERDRLDGCIRDLEVVSGRLTSPRALSLTFVQQMAQTAVRGCDAQVAEPELDKIAEPLWAKPWRKPAAVAAKKSDTEDAEAKAELNKAQVTKLQAAKMGVRKASEQLPQAAEWYDKAMWLFIEAGNTLEEVQNAPVRNTDAEAQAWRKHVESRETFFAAGRKKSELQEAYDEAQQRLLDIEKEVYEKA